MTKRELRQHWEGRRVLCAQLNARISELERENAELVAANHALGVERDAADVLLNEALLVLEDRASGSGGS